MSGEHIAELRNPVHVALTAINLVQEHDRLRFGWPRHDGKERTPPALTFLSPDMRLLAELVAAETLADWRQAGRPFLGRDPLKRTYQYLITCPAFSRHVRPLAENDNKEQE
jgi:hypothetical protein